MALRHFEGFADVGTNLCPLLELEDQLGLSYLIGVDMRDLILSNRSDLI